MARAVVASLEKGVEALCDGRLEVVSEVKDAEEESDREEVRIERECLRILALYEPVASDLRRLATIMKVSRDCERIADLAARIARRARKLARKARDIAVPDALKSLARDVLALGGDTNDALVARDARRARTIIEGERIDRPAVPPAPQDAEGTDGEDTAHLGSGSSYSAPPGTSNGSPITPPTSRR